MQEHTQAYSVQQQQQGEQQEEVGSGDELSALDWLGLCSVDDGVENDRGVENTDQLTSTS